MNSSNVPLFTTPSNDEQASVMDFAQWHRQGLTVFPVHRVSPIKPLSAFETTPEKAFIQALLLQDRQGIEKGLKNEVYLYKDLLGRPYWEWIVGGVLGVKGFLETASCDTVEDWFHQALDLESLHEDHFPGLWMEKMLREYRNLRGEWPEALQSMKDPESKVIYSDEYRELLMGKHWSWFKTVLLTDVWAKDVHTSGAWELFEFWMQNRVSFWHMAMGCTLDEFNTLQEGLSQKRHQFYNQGMIEKLKGTHLDYLKKLNDFLKPKVSQRVDLMGALEKEPWRIDVFNTLFEHEWGMMPFVEVHSTWSTEVLKPLVENKKLEAWGIHADVLQSTALQRWMAATFMGLDSWVDPDRFDQTSCSDATQSLKILTQWVWGEASSPRWLRPAVSQLVLLAQWMKAQEYPTVESQLYWAHKKGILAIPKVGKEVSVWRSEAREYSPLAIALDSHFEFTGLKGFNALRLLKRAFDIGFWSPDQDSGSNAVLEEMNKLRTVLGERVDEWISLEHKKKWKQEMEEKNHLHPEDPSSSHQTNRPRL